MNREEARQETLKHIENVKKRLKVVVSELVIKGVYHDASKLLHPEAEIFEKYTSKLSSVTYGSKEYKATTKKMAPAIKHHYAKNRHHPEHFENGMAGMTLMDLIELICDWDAAATRHADGDVYKSIEINQERYGYNDMVKQILKNTLDCLNVRMVQNRT